MKYTEQDREHGCPPMAGKAGLDGDPKGIPDPQDSVDLRSLGGGLRRSQEAGRRETVREASTAQAGGWSPPPPDKLPPEAKRLVLGVGLRGV